MTIYKTGASAYSDAAGAGSQELVESFGRLAKRPPPEKRLAGAVAPEAIRAQTGLEPRRAGEVATALATVESTDGLFLFTVRVLA